MVLTIVYYCRMGTIRKNRAAVSLARKRMDRMTPIERSDVARLAGLASGVARRARAAAARKRKAA
jgi:ketopantoate reductase